jgi:hypothetical protein
MALPLAVAVPLNVFLAAEPLIPVFPSPFPGSARILFALGTLAGIPVVVEWIAIAWCLIRRRWKTLALLLGLTILMSLMIWCCLAVVRHAIHARHRALHVVGLVNAGHTRRLRDRFIDRDVEGRSRSLPINPAADMAGFRQYFPVGRACGRNRRHTGRDRRT